MTNSSSPNRFDPSSIFGGTKWNVLMLFVGLIGLCVSGSYFGDAYISRDWLPVAGWGFLIVVFGNSAWTSAFRLWRNRKPT